jgi:hypothetical protein
MARRYLQASTVPDDPLWLEQFEAIEVVGEVAWNLTNSYSILVPSGTSLLSPWRASVVAILVDGTGYTRLEREGSVYRDGGGVLQNGSVASPVSIADMPTAAQISIGAQGEYLQLDMWNDGPSDVLLRYSIRLVLGKALNFFSPPI